MPLTREQTSYSSINNTVFLPTVAIDNNLGVRGSSVFDGTARFNNSVTFANSVIFNVTPSFSDLNVTRLNVTNTFINGTWTIRTLTPGSTSGERSGISLWGTFFNYPADTGPRRVADILAGYSTGVWGTEYLAFAVGTGGQNDAAAVTTERMRINGDAYGTTTITGNLVQNVNATAKTAAYQLTTADANTIVQMNGAFAFQVDTSLAVLPLGTTITLVAQTTGVTVATTATATVPTVNATPGLKLRAAWSTASLIKMSAASASGTASTWLLTGDLTA